MKANKYGGYNNMPRGWCTQNDINSKIHKMWYDCCKGYHNHKHKKVYWFYLDYLFENFYDFI